MCKNFLFQKMSFTLLTKKPVTILSDDFWFKVEKIYKTMPPLANYINANQIPKPIILLRFVDIFHKNSLSNFRDLL